MKILMSSIIDLYSSQHNRPHQFVKELINKHEITVVSINDWWKKNNTNINVYENNFHEILDDVNYIYITKNKISPIIQELFLSKLIQKKIDPSFDAHINYNSIFTGYYFSKKIPTLFDIADDLTAMLKHSPQIPHIMQNIGSKIGAYMIEKNINNSKQVSITTNILKTLYNVNDNKTNIVPNGVDTSLFFYHKEAKNILNLKGFIIGYVGVLREWVDLEPLFYAIKKLNHHDIKIIVIGKEGEFYKNVELAKKYEISNKVIFYGQVKYSEIPIYISAMDVCVIPFKNNDISNGALPLKLFEYMACEKPVISSPIPAVIEEVGNNVLYASNAEDYIFGIKLLYENSDIRKKMGKKGKKLIENNYDWSILCKKVNHILLNM